MKMLWMRCGLSITIGVLLILISVSASVTYLPFPDIENGNSASGEEQGAITVVGPEDEEPLEKVDTIQDYDCGQLQSFSDSEEFKEYMEVSSQELEEKLDGSRWPSFFFETQPNPGATAAMLLTDSTEYSNTNIQVEGVDEPDIVKTDGEYLYVKSGNEIVILKAFPSDEARVLSRIGTVGGHREMFVSGSRLVLFESSYGYYGHSGSTIKIYDISSRSSPFLVQNLTFDQRYFDARLIGDYVYVVLNGAMWYYVYDLDTHEKSRVFKLPEIVNNGETTTIDASGICYCGVPAPDYSLTIVASLSLQDNSLKYKVYLTDSAQTMYVSMNNIYLASWDYSVLWGGIGGYRRSTMIHKISIDEEEIHYEGNGSVPGGILNQFSMDEHEGYFRVATSEFYTQTNVYVLNEDLEVVGELEGLVPDEIMHSARFLGERCYLVTFKSTDPFFVIDLSNPEHPEVLGELKIPGYSDYLHPYDENHIIGLGKDAYDMGSFAWYQGVKLSMFDVTDLRNPREISTYVIGDRGTTSPALSDHKAFMFSRSKNLLILPISLYEIDESKYPNGAPPEAHGEFVWQGAYVLSLTWNLHFKLRGRITHYEAGDEPRHCWYSQWGWGQPDEKPMCIGRSLYIEDGIYTISEGMVKINSMDSLDEIKAIEL